MREFLGILAIGLVLGFFGKCPVTAVLVAAFVFGCARAPDALRARKVRRWLEPGAGLEKRR